MDYYLLAALLFFYFNWPSFLIGVTLVIFYDRLFISKNRDEENSDVVDVLPFTPNMDYDFLVPLLFLFIDYTTILIGVALVAAYDRVFGFDASHDEENNVVVYLITGDMRGLTIIKEEAEEPEAEEEEANNETGPEVEEATGETGPEVEEATINEMEDEEECSICLLDLEPQGQQVAALDNCEHKFHHACIVEWASTRRSCPLCRSPIGHLIFS